ncbi:hypothetical protein [Nostoc sp. 'Lobaria pulmonaria (5183) cyanobiont']|uniref:hypothetical protein n=1 Tax=Nostoc sp. 'Lobaria pulmonaria (5183) cyanobiont' TaxID=1618022 RepID=UPI000CF3554C|nr:hypothetical protein [Nostoc sp. 'Lobaria pulmonaria (5183) cyanobiont']
MEIDNLEQLKELEGYPEGEAALKKYYSNMLDRDDDYYEIYRDVCAECWEDELGSILDPRDGSCPRCDCDL